jgi:hypothetical protein
MLPKKIRFEHSTLMRQNNEFGGKKKKKGLKTLSPSHIVVQLGVA